MSSSEHNDIVEASMMDIAGLDLSGIKSLSGGGLPVGIYTFEAKPASWEKGVDKNDIARWVFKFPFTVLEVKGLADKNDDPDAYLGKGYSLMQYVSLESEEKRNEGLGYVKGTCENLGVDTDAIPNLGGVEGGTPGWCEAVEGFRFEGKIKSETGRDGVARTKIDIPALKKKK